MKTETSRQNPTSGERVLTAFAFKAPDRIPRFDGFWSYPEEWKNRFGAMEDLSDISIWCPDEGAFPTRKKHIKEDDIWTYSTDSWGRTSRSRKNAYFVETLEVPIPPGTDPDKVKFDPPDLESRYRPYGSERKTLEELEKSKKRYCVFGKTGGPYLRTTFVRGETQFLIDIASDPELALALADKMADHLTAIAKEEILRWDLGDTGVWIYDDMAYNDNPMFSPSSFEKVFLPGYRRMVKQYKEAGAKYVLLHSDGNIMPLLDMLVDAGIDGLNPLERRAGMNVTEIRKRYPHLILTGGMCNTRTLPFGTPDEIEREAKELIDMGRNGGVVIGTHSISPEVPIDSFAVYHNTCLTYGNFS